MDNLFQNLPADLTHEVFETLAASKSVKIERITSLGHVTPEKEWYDQTQSEWVMVLQGEAVLAFEEGQSMRLQPGDFVNIEPHQRHRVQWTDPHQITIWLAVYY